MINFNLSTVYFKNADFILDTLYYTQPFKIINSTIYITCKLKGEDYIKVEISYNKGISWEPVPLSAFYCDITGYQAYKNCNTNATYRLKCPTEFDFAKILI